MSIFNVALCERLKKKKTKMFFSRKVFKYSGTHYLHNENINRSANRRVIYDFG